MSPKCWYLPTSLHLRLEVLTAVMMSSVIFWVATSFGLVGCYQRFGGTCRLYIEDRR
jgi:hypothetical protein